MEEIILLQNDSLTTEEVAQALKVSKLTVYDLIKKGDLPSYRVGRQIRVNRTALEEYTNRGNRSIERHQIADIAENGNMRPIIISGQDNCLDILAKQIEGNHHFRPLRSYTGSLDGLVAMYQGKGDIVSTHLFDGDTKTYNIPYIRKLLVSKSFIVIHLLKRKAGFFVAKGNPNNITSWDQFNDGTITMVNREPGAGARVLLDEQLRLHAIDKTNINGYSNEVTSHIDVASTVASGQADVGVGTWHAAKMADIDFVPMVEEYYDLVILKSKENNELIQTIMQVVQNKDFQKALQSLGHNIQETGNIRFEQ